MTNITIRKLDDLSGKKQHQYWIAKSDTITIST